MLRLGIVAAAIAAGAAVDVHVSPAGQDTNAGSQAAPVATIQRAQALVREHARHGGSPVTVRVAPGIYYVDETLALTGADSGVAWVGETATGSAPVLSGGAPINASSWQAVAGYTDVYAAQLPASTWPELVVRQLFSAGDFVRRNLTSTPVVQYAQLLNSTTIIAQPGQLAELGATDASLAGASVLVYHTWTSDVTALSSWNLTSGALHLGPATGDSFYSGSGNRYAIQNLQDAALLSPGTFFFNRSSRVLTYRALPGENPTDASAPRLIAPRLATVLQFNGSVDVSFSNFVIAHTAALLEEQCEGADACGGQSAADLNGGAIIADNSTGLTFSGMEVTLTGQYGMWMRSGVTNTNVSRAWLHNLGAGGIRVGTSSSGLPGSVTQGVTVEDSVIEGGGMIVEAGAGILMQEAARNTFVHNSIRNMKYTGISTGWTWGYQADPDGNTLVGWNDIHDIGLGLLSDMGCIYNLGRAAGTNITNNVCHDVVSYGYGGWGIYTDEGSSNVTITNNIVYHTKSAGIHQHYGTDNVFSNNVIAFTASVPCDGASGCDSAGVRSSQHGGSDPNDHGRNSSFAFERNIVLLNQNYSTLFYTTMADGFKNMTLDDNVYWSTAVAPSSLQFPSTQDPTTFQEWQAEGKDLHSVVADPQFVNASGLDFSHLVPSSPALQLGFVPIDTSTVGPRPAPAGVYVPWRR